MKSWSIRARPLFIALGVAAAFAACDEQLDSGSACPALCPVPPGQVRDTSFIAVAMDTSVAGFPARGFESQLFIASFGDTLQTRAVIRFDTLPTTFRHHNTAADSAILSVDTGAVLRVYVAAPDTTGVETTIEAYDVDLGGAEDTNPDAVGSAFTPERLLGSRTLQPTALKDSIDIPIDPAKLLTKIQTDTPSNRLRVGLRVTSATGSAKLSIQATNASPTTEPRLIFRPAAGDTSVAIADLTPYSKTPADALLADAMRDYLAILIAPPEPAGDVIRVGGIRGRRGYMLFDIPPRLLDSTNIIRATLMLTQRPSPEAPRPNDTVSVEQFAVSAGAAVTDISRRLRLLYTTTNDTIRTVPAASGVKALEVIGQVGLWRTTTAARSPRAIALRDPLEGLHGGYVDFYSIEAPAALRPVLRLTYVPRTGAGLP